MLRWRFEEGTDRRAALDGSALGATDHALESFPDGKLLPASGAVDIDQPECRNGFLARLPRPLHPGAGDSLIDKRCVRLVLDPQWFLVPGIPVTDLEARRRPAPRRAKFAYIEW